MGAIEHLKTLCCLGLPPESAMIGVVPLLHEIIPHGWSRMALLDSDGAIANGYSEHPELSDLYQQHMWRFLNQPSSPMSMWMRGFRAGAIGWTLHMQGRGWMDNSWYREMEAPVDSCWILDAMIGNGERTNGFICLTRPRGAKPFSVDDVRRLDPLRPWIGHAFRRPAADNMCEEVEQRLCTQAGPVLSGQLILTKEAAIVFQSAGLEHVFEIVAGDMGNYTRRIPLRDRLPAPILELVRRIVGASNGSAAKPPRMQISNAYGMITLEAKWLMPPREAPADVAKDPKSCLISVSIELREHAVAHAARILRVSGATPTQLKVGIQLALGKSKPTIATELGLKHSTVADLARKLYQTLDVHNSTELGTRLWLARPQILFN
jgi:DNA-binding CsgD family transcriptional regulator